MELITERRQGLEIKTRVVPNKKKYSRKSKFVEYNDRGELPRPVSGGGSQKGLPNEK